MLSDAELGPDRPEDEPPGERVGSGPNITDPIRDPLPGVFKEDLSPVVAEGTTEGAEGGGEIGSGPVDAVGAGEPDRGRPRCAAVAARPRAAPAAASEGVAVGFPVVAGVAILYLNPRIKFDDKKPHTQVELAQWTNIVMMNWT